MSASSPAPNHSFFQRFVHSEVSGSVVLLASSLLALAWANSPWADSYFELIHTYLGVSLGGYEFKMSLQHWVNDALMVLFFFVIGLEIKREISVGELSGWSQASLPVAAAIGGMVVPAAMYMMLNRGGEGVAGWGIPMATDIAFALGILALFGSRAPIGLKIFLTALAIADDLGAVLVIAIFYTEKIHWSGLLVAAVLLLAIWVADRVGLRGVMVYLPLIVGVWAAVLASGVHATVAGILVAFLVPVRARLDPGDFIARTRDRLSQLKTEELSRESPIFERRQREAIGEIQHAATGMLPAGVMMEEALHPIQAFWVLPLFALFNAGVPISSGVVESLGNPIGLGVIAGLLVGKPVGVLAFSWLAVRSGRASLPAGVGWGAVLGAGCLAGVGFTMSLFVSELAFDSYELVSMAKIGILTASFAAGACGFVILRASLPSKTDSNNS